MFIQHKNFRDSSHFNYYEKPQLSSKSTVDDQNPNGQNLNSWQPNWMSANYVNLNQHAANICPSCTKIVLQLQSQLVCRSPENKFYLAHTHCLQDLPYFIETGPRAKKISTIQPFIPFKPSLGQQRYFITISIYHPLSKKRLFRTTKDLSESRKKIFYTPLKDEDTAFSENFIISPMKQFQLTLNLEPHSQKQTKRQRLILDVDLSEYKDGVHYVRFQQDGIIFQSEMEIILDNKAKQQIVNQMNIIYKRPYEKQQWVLLKRFSVEFKGYQIQLNPQSTPNQEKYQNQNYTSLNSQIVYEEEVEQFDIKRVPSIQFTPVQPDFISLIKTQAGSKQFQKKVKNLQKFETDKVIVDIIPYIEQIVLDNYANYMFQSLLSVCSYEQRMIIIENIGEKISILVCQQQGTFVFQQLILLLTNAEEFHLIFKYIEKDFRKVALDNYGFHFLRKLFQKMPVEQIMLFLPIIFKNFKQFSTNKNAIFIMKCTLNCLVALQNTSSQASVQLKKFLDLITSNTQKLISDQFGNYLIQLAFEKVSPEKIKGIFEQIIKYFADYSCNKISSNVIVNCIANCWKNSSTYFVNLKNSLDRRSIRTMYFNPQGNKVLLQIMDLNLKIQLKDKIVDVVKAEALSKYNSRRWTLISRNPRTGMVGTNYNTFAEATTSFEKETKFNYIHQRH